MTTERSIADWRAFSELLADAADVLDWPGLELDDLDRAEGLRYLARLLENAVGAQLGTESSRHPAFRLVSNGFGMDNPDNHYLGAPVDPEADYLIRGRRGTLSYLSFAAQNQNFAAAERITGGAGHLQGGELVCADEGSFEILASQHEPAPDRPGGRNWLRLAADSTMVLARQTRADPATEDWVDLTIERVGFTDPPPPLDPARLSGRLSMVALYTIGASRWFVDWVRPWLDRPNTFERADPDEQQLVGGDPNILAQSGYWTFGPDEALVVEVTPPPCAYWNIQLANVWAECLDARRPVWRNNVSSTLEADGSVRFVLAHRDPGHPNWLDTAGHRHGLMHLRFVNSDGWPLAASRLVRLDEVPDPPEPR
jgi:hypothetical protein